MSQEEISTIVKATLEEVKKETRNSSGIFDMFITGMFRFIVPGLVTFLASYFALEKSVEIMKVKFELKMEQCQKEFNEHRIDNEKKFDNLNKENYEQNKDFDEFVKEYYKSNPGKLSELSKI